MLVGRLGDLVRNESIMGFEGVILHLDSLRFAGSVNLESKNWDPWLV